MSCVCGVVWVWCASRMEQGEQQRGEMWVGEGRVGGQQAAGSRQQVAGSRQIHRAGGEGRGGSLVVAARAHTAIQKRKKKSK